MLRISKLTDYGTLLLSTMANSNNALFSASELSEKLQLSSSAVSKILKQLTKAKILTSTRGAHGGYQLARSSKEISALEIIRALEGPVALTECSTEENACDIKSCCDMQSKWQIINLAIRSALDGLSLAELSRPIQKRINIDLNSALSSQIDRININAEI